MKTRVRFVLITVALLPLAPAAALAGICFNVTGLPVPAAFDLVPMTPWSDGQVPIVGEADGVCGAGAPSSTIRGTVTGDPGGVGHLAFKFLSSGPGCSGGEAEIVLPPPYESGTGQVRLPEGSVADVVLSHDPTGSSCVAVAAGDPFQPFPTLPGIPNPRPNTGTNPGTNPG